MKLLLPIFATTLASTAMAEGSRELDAHEHGVGELNIAMDGNVIAMELHAPGADIVGFEYTAESAEDRAAVDAAVAMLAKPLDLFVMPDAAECTVTQASAALEMEDDHGAHDHDHEDHAEADDEHDHDDHAHDDHSDHDHGDEEAQHTEFHAEYLLTCGDPNALSEINFAYFEIFENTLELEVQLVTETSARSFEVERDNPELDLRGMF